MLYVKDGRRYKQAPNSEVLFEAMNILIVQGLSGISARLGGMAELLEAQEDNEIMTHAKREAEAKDNPSPYKE